MDDIIAITLVISFTWKLCNSYDITLVTSIYKYNMLLKYHTCSSLSFSVYSDSSLELTPCTSRWLYLKVINDDLWWSCLRLSIMYRSSGCHWCWARKGACCTQNSRLWCDGRNFHWRLSIYCSWKSNNKRTSWWDFMLWLDIEHLAKRGLTLLNLHIGLAVEGTKGEVLPKHSGDKALNT